MPLSSPVTATAVECSSGSLGRAAVASMQGVRNNHEDAHCIDQAYGFCGVYDGHLGDEASAFCAERLHLHVAASIGAAQPSREAFLSAFSACDNELRENLPGDSEAGTTATIAMARSESSGLIKIFVASCGDSRAVLWRKDGAIEQTRDHRPDSDEERARIEAAGGFVSDEFDPPRVDGKLACSRALGAFKFKQDQSLSAGAQKVSSVPETYEWAAAPGDWLILACDGVWDTFSSERVVAEVHKAAADGDLGEALAKTLSLCIEKDADDNLTLMAIELGAAPEESPLKVTVTAGNFLKTKDKEVLEQYSSFCLRFGYSLTKEMRPKAPPVASLTEATAVPGLRFSKLPSPPSSASPAPGPSTAIAKDGETASLEFASGSSAELLEMKVTAKRAMSFYLRAAKELMRSQPGRKLEVTGLGNAISNATGVAAALAKDGCQLVQLSTGLVEVESRRGKMETPRFRAVVQSFSSE